MKQAETGPTVFRYLNETVKSGTGWRFLVRVSGSSRRGVAVGVGTYLSIHKEY